MYIFFAFVEYKYFFFATQYDTKQTHRHEINIRPPYSYLDSYYYSMTLEFPPRASELFALGDSDLSREFLTRIDDLALEMISKYPCLFESELDDGDKEHVPLSRRPSAVPIKADLSSLFSNERFVPTSTIDSGRCVAAEMACFVLAGYTPSTTFLAGYSDGTESLKKACMSAVVDAGSDYCQTQRVQGWRAVYATLAARHLVAFVDRVYDGQNYKNSAKLILGFDSRKSIILVLDPMNDTMSWVPLPRLHLDFWTIFV